MSTAAIIGGGVIGGGWAARFLLNGWDVRAYDPGAEAERRIGEVLANARAALPRLYETPMPPEGRLSFHPSVAEAVMGADWIQESVPERLEVKHAIFAEIQTHSDAMIGSSTSGFKPSQLGEGARNPRKIIVAHPFNPVYLLPLVELVGDGNTCRAGAEMLEGLGMYPLRLRKEIDAHIADRFLEAVWREALWLIKDGVATTAEVDEAIRMGFGLRWAQMGLFETYRIAGGEAGMRHFLAQFGPALKWPWTKLMDVPELTGDLVERIAEQSDAQSGAHSIRDLERIRDDNLVGILTALRDRGWGAGALLAKTAPPTQPDLGAPPAHPRPAPAGSKGRLHLTRGVVLPGWIDYNGHMTEHRYLQLMGETTDALLTRIGAGADYVAAGHSFYTVETHLRHLAELRAGDAWWSETHILSVDEKRLHLFHGLHGPDGLAATAEQMLLHVDVAAGRACPAAEDVQTAMAALAASHASLPRPDGAGRSIGMPL